MRVAIICEGSTDHAVLASLVRAMAPVHEMIPLQPDFDGLRRPAGSEQRLPTGWQAVRSFLGEYGPGLAVGEFDLVVIQVDASIRHLSEIARSLNAPGPTADRQRRPGATRGAVARTLRTADPDTPELAPLCDHVKSWSPAALPAAAAVTLPREATEAWLLAGNTNAKRVEDVEAPEHRLVEKGLIGVRNGDPEKLARRYAELAKPLARLVRSEKALRPVPELERFAAKVRERARAAKRRRDRAAGGQAG